MPEQLSFEFEVERQSQKKREERVSSIVSVALFGGGIYLFFKIEDVYRWTANKLHYSEVTGNYIK